MCRIVPQLRRLGDRNWSTGRLHQRPRLHRRRRKFHSLEIMVRVPRRVLPLRPLRHIPRLPTLEQSAEENAHSPSIQPAMVPNTDAPEIDEQALAARFPVRVVWPLPVSEIPSVAAGTTAVAKNEGEQMVRPEAHVETTGQTESSPQPRERTSESLRITPSTVLLFLAIGLPWVGVLAWLGITANSARGERLVRNHLQPRQPAIWITTNAAWIVWMINVRPTGWTSFLPTWHNPSKPHRVMRLLHRQNTYHRIRRRLKRRAQDCGLRSDTERAEV